MKNYINISNLEYSDKYNTIINIHKYININYTNFIEKTSYIKIINNYLFIEQLDHLGDDIYFNNNYTINEMINYSNNDNNIIAFNTHGFFKNKLNINSLVKNKYIKNNYNGIFIKIDKLTDYNKYLKINNINTLDTEYKCETNIQTLINNIEKSDYIGFNSIGLFKKDINLENIINISPIYNNYLCININKYINYKLNNKQNKRVKLICDWCSSEDICYQINKMTKGSLLWNNIKFTYDDNLVDYYIIFNNIDKDTYYDPEKTIIFINIKNESNIYKNNFMKKININLNENYYFWKINKTYIELTYETFIKTHNKIFINLSNEYENKIEINNLVKYIKNNNYILDIYTDNLQITNYKYGIIIQEDDNIIKLLHNIFDIILSECLCFYSGTDDIFNYIDQNTIIKININNLTETYDILKDSIIEDIFSKKIDLIKKQKLRILDYYNICPTIERLINNNLITKTVFQTSKNKPEKYIYNMFNNILPNNWIYKHFDDNEIIDFFKKNPLYEFPNIIDKFNSFNYGQHKADLFRYYYIYIYGGVFIDSDAMIVSNIENIIKNYSFFSVNSQIIKESIFQGFIGANPKNEIIYSALKDIYNIDNDKLNNDYHLLCKNLYKIINNFNKDLIKLYNENCTNNVSYCYDDNKTTILIHFYLTKTIPKNLF